MDVTASSVCYRSCMLQAESEKLRQAWIQAVQASIASAYRESPDTYYIEVSRPPPVNDIV
jgi:1,2-phenylacetyl-CoA epoxidase catalytic subunit